jgi:hypothetical protein
MSKYTKYKLYQKYETRGSQEAIPCYPNVFSIDGDGTMPLVIVEENSRDCGYTGETQPIYRWYTLPIDTYYYCDACQDAQYKWVNLPISQDWECVGTTKYYKQKKQVSVDGGSTWTDVTPPQYQRGALYEYSSQSCGYRTRTTSGSPYCEQYDKYVDVYSQYSTDGGNTWQTTATTPTMVEHNSEYCGYIEPQYRTTSGDTYCSGVNKYVPVYSQVSYDGGVTWETTATTQTLVERNSPDCGYGYKLRATFSDSSYYDIVCNSDPVIRMYEAQDNHVTGMTSLDIGTCVTEITKCAFDNGISYPNLVSVTLPNTLTTIGNGAFQGCDALPSITIPDSVTSIDSWAFSHLDSLRSAVIGNGLSVIKSVTFYGSSNLASVTIGTGVTTIEDSAFYGCGLTSLTIPNSVTTIGSQAFSHNSNLASLTIGNGVTSIGDFGFGYCGITSLTIPNSVTSISNSAFWGCNSLSSATIGSGVTNINFFQECANLRRLNSNVDGVINIPSGVTTVDFYECPSFTSISIPNTVSSVTLTRCSGLTSVVMPDSVTHVGSCAGCASLTSVEIGTGVTSVDNYSFQGCSSLTSYTIRATTPPTVGEWAFNDRTGCPIYVPCESLSAYRTRSDWTNFRRRVQPMPNSCTTPVPPQNFDGKIFAIYNDNTFYSGACDSNTILTSADTQVQGYTYTAMTSAIIGDCVTEIGASAFKSFYGPFYSLSSVTIGSGVTTIGASAFSQCYALSSVTIPDSATTIRDWAFNSCGITSLTIPDSVTSIDWHAFQSCSNLASATIGSGLTSISAALFYNCRSLTSVTIPDTVTSINSSAFTYCTSLVSINIPNGVTSIASNAFYFCTSLTSVTIPDSVTEIDWNAFGGCSSLTSIEIPSGVTYIGDSAFTSCDSLTSITINATTPPTLGSDAFWGTNNCPIYVPCNSVAAYKAASGWSEYASRIQGIPPCNPNPYKLVSNYSNGTSYSANCDSNATLTSGDTKPSGYEFTAITSVEIGNCITSIDAYSFWRCSGLTSVIIPSSVTSIGMQSFSDCYALASINIPDSVTSIVNNAFNGSSGLTSVEIGSGVTSIGSLAFRGCSNLASVTIKATTPPTLGMGVFYYTKIEDGTGYIYVPASSVNAYKSAEGWSDYASRIQAIP